MTDILADSLSKCRMPVWRAKETATKDKLEAIEEYMLLTAFYRGELAEERAQELVSLDALEERYDAVDITWTKDDKPRTDKGFAAAKAEAAPDVAKQLVASQRRVKRLTEEMERLDRDATVASRVYTVIVGS